MEKGSLVSIIAMLIVVLFLSTILGVKYHTENAYLKALISSIECKEGSTVDLSKQHKEGKNEL